MSIPKPVNRLISHPLPWIIGLFLVCFPITRLHLSTMWAQEHYQFIPFAFGLFVWLTVTRTGTFKSLALKHPRWLVRSIVLFLAMGLILFGGTTNSALPGYLGLVLGSGLILDLWLEKDSKFTLAYLTVLLLITVRLPMRLDQRLIQSLQSVTSQISSRILDAIGVTHLQTGNVLETVDGVQLFVEEACSGVQSLFTLVFIATAITTIRRHSLVRFIALSATAIVWAIVMNTLRVVSIAMALTQINLDLTSGWKHDLVGHAAMLIAALLLFSTDRLMDFLLNPMPQVTMKHRILNPFVTLWNYVFSPYQPSDHVQNAAPSTGTLRSIAHWAPVGIIVPLCIVSLIAPLEARKPMLAGNNDSLLAMTEKIIANMTPLDDSTDTTTVNFEMVERNPDSQFGELSGVWEIECPIGLVRHSIDYPFNGWHDLSTCYTNIGWERIESRELQSTEGAKNAREWPGIVVRFLRPTGEHAYLCFSMISADGTAIFPEGQGNWLNGFQGRIADQRGSNVPLIQLQTMHATLVEPSDDIMNTIRKQHSEFRERYRAEVQKSLDSMQETESAQ